MSGSFDLGNLLSYSDFIMRQHTRYGPQCWLLLYQADTRFRLEHLPRLRRRLEDEHSRAVAVHGTTPFEPTRPWNFSLASGVTDSAWWNLEFTEPAMMLLARTASLAAFVGGDAPVGATAARAPGSTSILPHAVSYTHLTLPTKRIV